MTTQGQRPFDEQFYLFVARGMSPEAEDAYRERLRFDEELAGWAVMLRGFVDGWLGPPDSHPEVAGSESCEKLPVDLGAPTRSTSDVAQETLDAQRLDSLSRALRRTDTHPVAEAWLRLTGTFGDDERRAYWAVVVDRRPLAEVAVELGRTEVDVEIYVLQVGRFLARELEQVG